MLKLPKKEWLTRFAGTPLESISEWVRYYYISPVDYSYNDDGTIIKIEDVISIIDLGTITWEKYAYQNKNVYYGIPKPANLSSRTDKVIIDGYVNNPTTIGSDTLNDREFFIGSNINIRDDRYNLDEFRVAMNGVDMLYLRSDSPL